MRAARAILAVAALIALPVVLPAAAAAAGTTTSSATAVAGGWGANPSTYIGKYTLVPATEAAAPTTQIGVPAGVFSVAVRAAAQLDTASGPVSSGQLVTFLRKVKTGEPLAPSGILSLFGAAGSQVLYLTDLDVHASRRVATVNGGSFLGVPIGTLTATAGARHSLNAVIKASGLGTVHLRLADFTAAPPSS